MDLTKLTTIKSLLKKHNLWAKKKLGQYFLIDKKVLDSIIETADLKRNDIILEIGPGIGVLTSRLCKKAGRVIAVEKDKEIIEVLKETCSQYKNLEIINEDVLILEPRTYNLESNYKIVANLPYYITSKFIRKFLEIDSGLKEMILMVQKEVAERICAKQSEMSVLAASVQFYGKPEMIKTVKKESFWPQPEIDSAVLKVTLFKRPLFDIDPKSFFKVIKAGFGERRKKLINSLSGGLQLDKTMLEKLLRKAKINPDLRAQDLSLNDWKNIYEILEKEKIL